MSWTVPAPMHSASPGCLKAHLLPSLIRHLNKTARPQDHVPVMIAICSAALAVLTHGVSQHDSRTHCPRDLCPPHAQVLRSTLAFFAEHLGASAAERYPRPAIDERRMASIEKMITPSGVRQDSANA